MAGTASAGTPGRTRTPLPPPDKISDRLGGRRAGSIKGQASYRLPHICGGESQMGDNPGLVVWMWGGRTRMYCHYGCEYKDAERAVRDALGDYSSDEQRPHFAYSPKEGTPRPRRPFVEPRYHAPDGYELIPGTGWPVLQGNGTYSDRLNGIRDVWTAWCPYVLADGRPRKVIRQFPPQPGAPKSKWDGDVGRSVGGLIPHLWTNSPAGVPLVLVIVEGEKAAAALVSSGAPVGVASVSSTAGLQNANYRPVVEGRHVIIWPDADDPVDRHGKISQAGLDAAKIAIPRIQMAGALSVRLVDIERVQSMVTDGGKRDGADAADLESSAVLEVLKNPDFGCNQGEEWEVPHADIRSKIGVFFDDSFIDADGREPEPPRPPSFWCRTPRWLCEATASTGDYVKQYYECGKCTDCIAWHKVLKVRRYFRGIDDETEQTVASLRLPTLADVVVFRKRLDNMDDAPRVSLVQPWVTGGWLVEVVFADLSEKRARAFAKRHGATVRRGRLTHADFIAMLPDKKCYGGIRAVSFAGGWRAPGYRRRKTRYITNHGNLEYVANMEFKSPPAPFKCENEEVRRRAAMASEEEAAYLCAEEWMTRADMSRIADFWPTWARRLAGKNWLAMARTLQPVIKWPVSEGLLRDAARCWLGMIPLRAAFVPLYEQIASPWPPPPSEQPSVRKSSRDNAAAGYGGDGAINVKEIINHMGKVFRIVSTGAEEQLGNDPTPHYAQERPPKQPCTCDYLALTLQAAQTPPGPERNALIAKSHEAARNCARDHGTPRGEGASLEFPTTPPPTVEQTVVREPVGDNVYSRLASVEPGYWDGVDEECEETNTDILGRPRAQWTEWQSDSIKRSSAWHVQQKPLPIFESSQATRLPQDSVGCDEEGVDLDWFLCQCLVDQQRERLAKSMEPAPAVLFCRCGS